MVIPLHKRNPNRIKTKLCIYKEPGATQACGKEFTAHYLRKYCELHANIANRVRRHKTFGPDTVNQEIPHHYRDPVIIRFNCALPGCLEVFDVVLYSKFHTYPKYCTAHRNEFKREFFIRQQRSQNIIPQTGGQHVGRPF